VRGGGVGGSQRARPGVTVTLRAARFATSPATETSETDPTNAMYPRQQLFLTLQHFFQALDEGFEATRCTAIALPVAAHAASATPPTLARCHALQRILRRTSMRAFSFHIITPFAEIFWGDFAGQFLRQHMVKNVKKGRPPAAPVSVYAVLNMNTCHGHDDGHRPFMTITE
jgi:hypothetical protein